MTTLLVSTSLATQIQNIRFPSVNNIRNELNSGGCPPLCKLAYMRCFNSLSESILRVLLRENRMCALQCKQRKSVVTLRFDSSLNLIYYPSRSQFHIQRRGFRTQRLEKVEKPKKGFFAILGINTIESVRRKGPQTKAFREKLKTVSDNDRKGFLEGYMAALDYSNEQKQKRSLVRTVLFSATVVGLGIYIIFKSFGIPQTSLFTSVEEVDPEVIGVTFKDVRGTDEAKNELRGIVSYLRDPERYTQLGARLPKGVLLVGPPGTGKTLLAKAIAGEAQVPFFQASGSEFDELFVGQGARRVRDLFDAALLRPGRFDIQVQVPYPDLEGRKEIIQLYLGRISVNDDVNEDVLARGTTGFTGAEIENMINQAALKAAGDGFMKVTMAHMEEAKDRVMMGPARIRGRLPDEEANRITAFHEAGHTLVSMYTKHAIPVHKVTIIPRGGSLGHTTMLPQKDEYHVNRAQMLAQLDILMGGRVAEELIFGPEKITTGAGDDLRKATDLAKKMVKTFGMSDKVGLRIADDESRSLIAVNQLSSPLSEMIDKEIGRLLKESYERAKDILIKHKKEHELLAAALLQHETLSIEEVKELLQNGKLLSHAPEKQEGSKSRKSSVRYIYKNPSVIITPIDETIPKEERQI
ncbi:ATP-dependent metalloprotease YME1L1 [Loa loa]|uniref:ATP-dependent metalloprotease YME1L1 n=1 Tax=Loa loa TaxID=7209 RepID=A0A1S0UH57_LOALO|nr:ATP-dependent metalloprotease YME1L1 [Loa loa]EJD74217.1 ATP-dependent metalloprotease YME1L1 [Loa loa]